jgi:glycosyltransferase involved in cell wall biosynthesis
VHRLSGANPFDLFSAAGSAGGFYTLLAPYLISYSLFSKNRNLAKSAYKRFHPEILSVGASRVAVFTDTLEEINGVARTWNKNIELARRTGKELSVTTCSTAPGREGEFEGRHYFRPAAVYEAPEYPEQKLYIPPLLEMLRFCYENDFTHIHGATPGPLGLTAMAIARILKLPFCTTYHTSVPQYAGYLTGDSGVEDLMWRYIVWFYNQSDIIFSPSLATCEELAEKGIQESKFRLMPRGVDSVKFHPDKNRPLSWMPEGKKLLYVGRVSREKNLPLLCDAFKRLCMSVKNVSLIVVGDGPYFSEMKETMKGLPCLFPGYVEGDELTATYCQSDVFVFPSVTDTFGNVVLEAQACKTPVIVTDMGGPKENLIPGETGIIISGNEEGALVTAMRSMLANPAKIKRMGERARGYAESRSFEKAFDQYWELYKTVDAAETAARPSYNWRAYLSNKSQYVA